MPTLFAKLSLKQSLLEAERVASTHLGLQAISSQPVDFQGMFSKTIVVEMDDNSQWVVQLRDNEIDTTKVALAHAKLGQVVPLVHRAASQKSFFAYKAPFVPGEVWCIKAELTTAQQASIAAQVGSLLARTTLREPSDAIVETFVKPRLQHVLARSFVDVPHPMLETKIKELVEVVDTIKVLPLALIHEDVNAMNIILDGDNNVAGLVDWEAAALLPLGTNAWCIRSLSFTNRNRIDYETEHSASMAVAFWQAFTSSIPDDALKSPRHRVLGAVITAMQIGLIFFTLWAGNEGRSVEEMDQTASRLDWLKTTFFPLAMQQG